MFLCHIAERHIKARTSALHRYIAEIRITAQKHTLQISDKCVIAPHKLRPPTAE